MGRRIGAVEGRLELLQQLALFAGQPHRGFDDGTADQVAGAAAAAGPVLASLRAATGAIIVVTPAS